jgi:outer membrane protein
MLRNEDPVLRRLAAISLVLASFAAICGGLSFARAADAPEIAPPPRRAADASGMVPPPVQNEDGWIVTVRAMGAVSPSFPGSGQLRPYPFPAVSFRRIGEPEVFSTPDDGFGLSIIDLGYFRAGPVANFVFKRGQRDGLFGLRRVGLTHEVGGFVEFTPIEHIRTRAELRQGVDGHKGFVAVLSADLYGSTGPVSMSVGPRFDIGDNRYANAYFSVTPVEALLNGRLTPYEATGGFTSAGGVATLRYDFTDNANATIFGGLQRLTGSVGQSPIPSLIGSRNQFSAGLAIGRSFEVKGLW